MKVRVTREFPQARTPGHQPFRLYNYYLDVEGWPEPGARKRITIAEGTHGGFMMEKWELQRRDGRDVLAVFLLVMIMGHDLEQWMYYDMETGGRIDQ